MERCADGVLDVVWVLSSAEQLDDVDDVTWANPARYSSSTCGRAEQVEYTLLGLHGTPEGC